MRISKQLFKMTLLLLIGLTVISANERFNESLFKALKYTPL